MYKKDLSLIPTVNPGSPRETADVKRNLQLVHKNVLLFPS